MVNISTQLATIATEKRGEDVRDAIVKALKLMNGQMTPPSAS